MLNLNWQTTAFGISPKTFTKLSSIQHVFQPLQSLFPSTTHTHTHTHLLIYISSLTFTQIRYMCQAFFLKTFSFAFFFFFCMPFFKYSYGSLLILPFSPVLCDFCDYIFKTSVLSISLLMYSFKYIFHNIYSYLILHILLLPAPLKYTLSQSRNIVLFCFPVLSHTGHAVNICLIKELMNTY